MDVVTPENALDPNPKTLAIIGTDDYLDATGNGQGLLGIEVGVVNPEGVNIVQVDLLQHRRSPESDTRVVANLVLRLIDRDKLVVINNLWTSPNFRHVSLPRDDHFDIRNIALDGVHTLEALVDVRNEGGLGTAENNYEVGTLHMEVGYQPSSGLEQIYADSTEESTPGSTIPWTNLYPPPINEQYTSAFPSVFGPEAPIILSGRLDEDGTITGTPNTHIDNPADVVRSIFVQEMGRQVDAASFDAARTALSGQFFDGGIGAGWIQERMQARDVLRDLAVQAHGYVLPSATDRFKMVVYDAAAPSQFNFTQFHILMTADPNTPAAERALQSSFDVRMSEMAMVANTFRVRHGWHPGLKQFTKVCYASPGGSNHPTLAVELTAKCADSAQRYGDLPAREIDAYWISHDDTAYALLAHLVNYFWSQHCFVSFLTTLCACHLEPTDHVTINHPEVPALLDGARWEIERISFNPSEGTVFLICHRLVTLSFTYFAIRDQSGEVWFWWVAADRTQHWDTEPPTSIIRHPIDLDLDPIPYWLEVQATSGATYYIYPTLLGEPTAEPTAPPVGPGRVGSPTLRGIAPGNWKIVATPIGEVDVQAA
jgi:hypothetical protein